MTNPYPITRETREEAIFRGDGAATYGPFDLKIFDVDDVEVWTRADDAPTWSEASPTVTKTSGTALDTFSIAFPADVQATVRIKVQSKRVHERMAGVVAGTRIDPSALEKELSRIAATLQELRRDADRGVQVQFGDGYVMSDDLEDGDTIMVSGRRMVKGANASDIAMAQGYAEEVSDARELVVGLAAETQALVEVLNLPPFSPANAGKYLRINPAGDGYSLIPEGVVATRAALKGLIGSVRPVVFLTEAGREGIFVFRSGNYSAHVSLDTLEGVYVKATAVAASAGCWVRHLDEGELLNVKWFGAIGDDTANDRPAIDAAFAVAKAYHGGLHLPRGYYKYDCGGAFVQWDFTSVQYGFSIVGAGLTLTEIRLTNTPSAGNPALYWIATGPQYDKVFKGFGVRGNFEGTVLTLGKNELTDSFETSYFERFAVINQYASGTQSEALRLNYVLGCTFINSRVGCYANGAGSNYGVALRMRQACFNTFVNFDYGNANRGVDFTDFGSYGNVFVGGGSENCNWHVSLRSTTATRNKWLGGRYSLWTQYAIMATGGSDNVFDNIRDNNGGGPATVLDPANCTGVILKDSRTITQPSMPASTTAVSNTTGKTVMVRIGGGAYTVVNIGGFGMSKASNGDWTSWLLPAGSTIAITYSSAPSWSWLAPNF